MDEKKLKEILAEINKEGLARGYTLVLTTAGGSMFPLLRANDRIEIVKFNEQDLKNGDLILFKSKNDEFVAHRFILRKKSKDGYLFITKGDANFGCDRGITCKDIIGKITKIKKSHLEIRLCGAVGSWLNLFICILSLARVIYFEALFFRKFKGLIKRLSLAFKNF